MSAPSRPSFFAGQVLTAKDLNALQQYSRGRRRRQACITGVVIAAMAALCCRSLGTKCRCRRGGVTVDGEPWTEVTSLDAAGPDDRVFVLDPITGSVTFGDGEHGSRPPTGAHVQADYRVGAGKQDEVAS